MPAPPTQDELLSLADAALAAAAPGLDAQATARWARVLRCGPTGAQVVEGPVVVEVAGARGDGRLGDPATARTHDGWDPALLRAGPDAAPAGAQLDAVAEKVAIVSTRGVRAYEQRTAATLRVRRDGLVLAQTAPRLAALDAERLAADADLVLGTGDAAAAEPGEPAVVLGPWAVAEILRRAVPLLADRLGTRVVAPSINLSDSPRYPSTVPRSYDAEGVPVQPVPLIQDGVAHRTVHDSTTAAAAGTTSTGHAVAPAGLAPPRPRNLVLVGGGVETLEALAAPLEHGLLIATLSPDGRAGGVRMIRDGSLAEPVRPRAVGIDPLALLAHVQALTGSQRTVPAPGGGATVAPGLRAGAGLRVL
jgi:predicted Zn-dependent protease